MKKVSSVTVAFFISASIYLFYRSEKTLVNQLVIMLLSYDNFSMLKGFIVTNIRLNDLAIFSLPGGLWVFCATALSQNFYVSVRSIKLQVSLVPVLFALGLEFCQLLHWVNGRFDLWDVTSYVLFWLLADYTFKTDHVRQTRLSPFTLPGFICLAGIASVYLAHVNQ